MSEVSFLMSAIRTRMRPRWCIRTGLALCWTLVPGAAGETVTLKNGMEFRGAYGQIASFGGPVLSPAGAGSGMEAKLIHFVDDGLRRTFFSKYQVQNRRPDEEQLERILLRQPVTLSSRSVGLLGSPLRPPGPFDPWGRRSIAYQTQRGPIEILQGITEITPTYIRVQGLQGEYAVSWDVRLATSTLPFSEIEAILQKRLNLQQPDDHLKMVRLFLQAERYGEAESALVQAMKQFPELQELEDQLQELRRLRARQQLQEIRLRRDSGQHRLARLMLQSFPTENAPMEALVELEELAEEFQQQDAQVAQLLEIVRAEQQGLEAGPMRDACDTLLQEIIQELSSLNASRLVTVLQTPVASPEASKRRLARLISSWVTGGSSRDEIELAYSMLNIRELITQYLVGDGSERARLIERLSSEQAGTPETMARILAAVKPPRWQSLLPPVPGPNQDATEAPAEGEGEHVETAIQLPEVQAHPQIPGLYHVQIPGLKEGDTIYYDLQLPPEYQPTYRYPAIITLVGLGTNSLAQIDWWAGSYSPAMNMRLGPAARYGYVVICPKWYPEAAREYGYSAREHAAVLYTLRDALQRVSIDTDRVFLTGHSQGGDAAWDIALAHPDLWAGVIPVVATAHQGRPTDPRYISHYWPNARYLSLYFVTGERDARRLELNASEFNRYFHRTGFDTVVVEYRGRGHEHFLDEIQRLFQWMQLRRRDFFPKEVKEVVTRRSWDNFFWYTELEDIPARARIEPAGWPAKGAARPFPINMGIRDRNAVYVNARAGQVTVWLSPEMVDFEASVSVTLNGKKLARDVQPDTAVLLEDARTRADRQHPFWAKVRWDRNP